MLCDDLEAGMEGGREDQEGGDIYIYIITTDLVTVRQKPTQHCKAIFLQLKKFLIKKKETCSHGSSLKVPRVPSPPPFFFSENNE